MVVVVVTDAENYQSAENERWDAKLTVKIRIEARERGRYHTPSVTENSSVRWNAEREPRERGRVGDQ